MFTVKLVTGSWKRFTFMDRYREVVFTEFIKQYSKSVKSLSNEVQTTFLSFT